MPAQRGSQLFDSPPHVVDIYLPDAPATDSGGGVRLAWPDYPSQTECPCSINTNGSSSGVRQGQLNITVGNRIAFLSSTLEVSLVRGTKMVAVGQGETGRTFIVTGICSPNRPYGNSVTDIPALTYVDAEEIL
jgi:hypothetical protein